MGMSLEDYRLWRRRIDDAEAYQAGHYARWQKALDLFSMKYWEQFGYAMSWEDELVPVNYATTFVATMVAAIFARSPKMFSRARSERYVQFAETMDEVLERHWDENNVKDVMIQVIVDTILTGVGWVETGFVPVSGRPVPTVEEAEQGDGSLLQRASRMVNAVLGRQEQSPSQRGQLNERKLPGEFYTIRRSSYGVKVPRGYGDYWSMPYLILHDRLRVEDFLANPFYRHKDQLGQGRPVSRPETDELLVTPKYRFPGTTPDQPHDDQVIDLYTIWDKRSESVFTLSKRCEQPHVEPEAWPHYAEGFPVIPLRFNLVPDTPQEANFYPFGDIEPIFAQILEKSKARTQMADHRKRANLVVFVQQNTTTETQLVNYAKASGALEVVPVGNVQAIQVSPAIQIPNAIFQAEGAMNADLDRDSGLQLLLADSAKTQQFERATVAQIAQGNANLKTGYRVDRLEAFAKHLARYQAGLFWQHMSRMDVGELIGVLPSDQQWPALPSDRMAAARRVKRELEIRLEAGSTRPIQDDVLDREQFIRASAVMQQVSPSIFKRIERPWLAELARKFRLPNLEALILQALDEQETQVAMEEEQYLSQNIPQVVSPMEDHQAHLAVHAKAQPPTQARDQHLLAHSQRLQEQQASVRTTGQGVRQSADSPSAAEVGRMGTPDMAGLMGQGMNLRQGTGGNPITV